MVTMADLVEVVGAVPDPELPFVTIEELGILRDVSRDDGGRVTVIVTPTYSGCPATEAIQDSIRAVLADSGHPDADVKTVFSPAWSTDDISDSGKRKLEQAGIAPPRQVGESSPILCPRCRSQENRVVSEFGSTACKALMVCNSCGEPFDRFKEL